MKRKRQSTIALILVIFLPVLTRASFIDLVLGTCDGKTQFTCKDYSCIDKEDVCDEEINCPDGSDESPSLCEIKQCWAPKYFKCGDGACIHANVSLCDGKPDCSDGSDEKHCSSGTPRTTTGSSCLADKEFHCADDQCIPKSWMCDGHKDCINDETDGCNQKDRCEDHEFMCTKDKFCIPNTFRCDHMVDCKDGTDEANCDHELRSIDLTQCTKKNGKFACKDNLKCIDLQHVCNGKADCYDKSDEDASCKILKPNACPNCTHRCIETPTGGICLCDPGYVGAGNNSCVDENECETYGICDQKCVNTVGSYHCACDPKYVLQLDGRSCFIREGEGTIVYSVKDAIKGLTLKSRVQRTYFEEIPFSVGISAVGSDLYWTSIRKGSKSIVKATGFKDQKVIVTNGLGSPEDVAVDWITRNIYFSDYKFKRIVACSDDGNVCTVLHSSTIDKPRSVSLIPEQGLMFWSDWGKKPHIGRSGMDGSNSIEFVADDLSWPNGLAIDLPNERLYWVDAKLERVETIKLDRTDRRVILSESIHHPFSLAVFENKLYWSDLKDKEIHSCDKFTGKGRQSITREFYESIHGITIQHPLLEQTRIANPCSRHPCSDLCLLAPSSSGLSFSCACPINKNLSKDFSKCIETHKNPVIVAAERNRIYIVEHQAIGQSLVKSHRLSEEFFITAMVYNSRADALLLADLPTRSVYSWDLRSKITSPLITHGLGPISSMEYDEFGNNLYFCDEDSLSIEAISLTTFARSVITSGVYPEFPISLTLAPERGLMFVVYVRIAVKVHIDRISMDGSEVSRKHIVDVNSRGTEVKIHFNRELEKLFWVDVDTGVMESVDVDGNNREKLFAQESAHGFSSTGSILFWTNPRSPVLNSFDLYVDEHSKSLKLLDLIPGSETEFLLAAVDGPRINSSCLESNGGCSHLCIASHDRDTKKVCACPTGYSISADGRNCLKPRTCSLEQFQCFTGECLSSSVVCDNKKDCIHGEDEDLMHCNGPKCPAEQFLCFDQSRCVDRKSKCDGKYDCDDKSDEICHVNCTKDQFACDSGECIDLHFRCDGKVDCRDAHDELHCTMTSCAGNEFQCSSGQCIPKEWECDKELDCTDGSDEWSNCEENGCFEHEFKCNNEKCVDMSLTCNGFNDCGDDSDEFQCFAPGHHANFHKLCSNTEFFCMSNQHHCIPISARCNGTKECVQGEDERHCSNENPCVPEREFFCRHHDRCIPIEWVCDSHDDCGDGSDETKSACFNKTTKDKPCSGFKCNSGECIPLSSVCDSIQNCPDKSDENGKCHIKCEEFGCSQKCFQTPNGPSCRCKNGYELSSDNKTCVDVNECDMDICAQHCENKMGGFFCGCFSPQFRLRADRVSCKALGPSSVYVIASTTALFMTTNNIKHTSEISLGKHLFKGILGLDVDVMHNYVYVLLENYIVERVSVTNGDRKQLIAPFTVDFTVDWITEAVFTLHSYKAINVTSFNLVDEKKSNRNIRLYEAKEDHYISTLVVDPVAGYIFWFEIYPDSSGSIRRADCTGMNVETILSQLTYPVRSFEIDSFNGHLYWSDTKAREIHRMNYDGSNKETVLKDLEHDVHTFTFFENSIYLVSLSLLTVQKCKIYGSPPKKCEMMKLNTHKILRLSILQPNRQRRVWNPCNEHVCSEYGMCLVSPRGPQCICADGKIQDGKTDCSIDGSFSAHSKNMDDRSFGKYFAYFVVVCMIAGLAWITFSHISKRKGAILHRLHFHNPIYDIPSKSKARESLINAEEHSYETPLYDEGPKSMVYHNEMLAPARKTCLSAIEESNHSSESASDYRPTSKELLLVNTI